LSRGAHLLNRSVPKTSAESQHESFDRARFRPNVAAILEREDGKIFVGERVDRRGAWQFPQGGIDKGEEPLDALYREIKEEIGLRRKHYEVLDYLGGYRYLFPNGHIKWKIYRGQEQTYFRCRFRGTKSDFTLDTEHPEFRGFRWVKPKDFDLNWLPKFKREVYRQVLADFYGV
jgi:putative (di)nucleoside polyphosphate hydrolase